MYQCFHCLTDGVVWDADFTFEDYGLDGDGIVQVCHCTNCEARIEYYISSEDTDDSKYRYNITEEQYKEVENCLDDILSKH